MRNLRITTGELAKICGVSQGTVDRALNGRAGINIKTKEKILNTAKEFGYRPFEGNNNSEKEKSKQIGIIVFNLKNEYFSDLITNIEAECCKIGYSTVAMFTNYNKQHEIECIKRMYNIGVEGLILCAVNSGEEFSEFLRGLNMTVVAVGNDIHSVPYIGIDDFAAMKDLTNHIIEKEFKNIIYFSPAIQYEDAYAQKRRFEGFLEAVKDKRPYSVICDIAKINEIYPDDTAIICSNDYYALKVFFKAKNVKIIGFDNIYILDKYKIPITSVDYSSTLIAQEAVDAIINKRNKGTVIDYKIVER
ncbi:MAG: LacI family DNA-binding transcriptional regulator [Clostridia bacterium]|nr:LacI family DNA-binding transcriptional regulator [Clostridia bacterium]